MPQGPGEEPPFLGRAGFEDPGPGGEFGVQPVEGLGASFRSRGVVGRGIVLASPGGRPVAVHIDRIIVRTR